MIDEAIGPVEMPDSDQASSFMRPVSQASFLPPIDQLLPPIDQHRKKLLRTDLEALIDEAIMPVVQEEEDHHPDEAAEGPGDSWAIAEKPKFDHNALFHEIIQDSEGEKKQASDEDDHTVLNQGDRERLKQINEAINQQRNMKAAATKTPKEQQPHEQATQKVQENDSEEESKGAGSVVAVKAKALQKKSPAYSKTTIGIEPARQLNDDESEFFREQPEQSVMQHEPKTAGLPKQPAHLAENEWMQSVLDQVSEKGNNENPDEDKQPVDSEDD